MDGINKLKLNFCFKMIFFLSYLLLFLLFLFKKILHILLIFFF